MGTAIYLNFIGPANYYRSLVPGVTKIDVEKGKYTYTYYACGGYREGKIEVKKANTKLILPGCGSSSAGKNMMKFTVFNRTGGYITLELTGPRDYSFGLPRGETVLEVIKGKYKYTAWGCGRTSDSGTVRSNNKLIFVCVPW